MRIRTTPEQRLELQRYADTHGLNWVTLVQREFHAQVHMVQYFNDATNTVSSAGYELEFPTEQAALLFMLKY